MSDAQPGSSGGKKTANLGLILQIGFAVVNLSVLGGGAALVYMSTLGLHAPKITEETIRRELASLKPQTEEASTPFIYTMEKFVVNLGGDLKRTIRLEVNLEMLSKDGFEEIMNSDSRAQARDRIVRMLNDQSFSNLEPIQGKLFLKDHIAKEVNQILKKGIVKDVYFSDFVVQ
jgi:flagellar FliL protein